MTEIKYKDTIIKVKSGKGATLHTKDTIFTEDIVITDLGGEGADSPLPIEVSTEAEMNALLETAEVGSVYKYVGESGTYENGALYVVEGDGLISFTIDGVTYQAEEGMTWGEWVASEYNTGGYLTSSSGDIVYRDTSGTTVVTLNGTLVSGRDLIINSTQYEERHYGGGSND